jgi:hypothetical protein
MAWLKNYPTSIAFWQPPIIQKTADGYDRGVPHFSIKDLLLSMALIALGLGTIAFTLKLEPPWMSMGAYGLVLIGAGALTPLNRAWTGGGIGCLLYIVLVIVLIVSGH